MMRRIVLNISLTIRSPFLFRALDGGMTGVDAAQLRSEDGKPIIPADQIRGVLREALDDLNQAGATIDIDSLFGKPSSATNNEPSRGRISFSDLEAQDDLPPAGETTRIEIDDHSGAVKRGQMQILELVAPFGKKVTFSGEILAFTDANDLRDVLLRALQQVSSIGAVKSSGFGEIVNCDISVKTNEPLATPKPRADVGSQLRLRVSFDRPILVDAQWIAQNAFVGNSVVPGAVFKGALAERLILAGDKGKLDTALERLSFSHAFPEGDPAGSMCELPLPLSLISNKLGDFGDALSVPQGCGAMLNKQPALFQGDWKGGWDKALELLGRPKNCELPFLPRTRTKIMSETGTAEDEALFTAISRSTRGRTWLMDVEVEDCDAARQLVTILLNDGLDRIGKTEAHASFAVVPDAPRPRPRPITGTDDRYAVVLTTPALMFDAATLCDENGHWTSTPRDAYQAYWQAVLPGAVLHNYFAAQQFTGGYLARRRRAYGGDRYFPFLLTKAGSVFDIQTGDIKGLEDLCRQGLPVPPIAGQTVTWRTCPYMRENGYGRISADYLSDHDLRKGVENV